MRGSDEALPEEAQISGDASVDYTQVNATKYLTVSGETAYTRPGGRGVEASVELGTNPGRPRDMLANRYWAGRVTAIGAIAGNAQFGVTAGREYLDAHRLDLVGALLRYSPEEGPLSLEVTPEVGSILFGDETRARFRGGSATLSLSLSEWLAIFGETRVGRLRGHEARQLATGEVGAEIDVSQLRRHVPITITLAAGADHTDKSIGGEPATVHTFSAGASIPASAVVRALRGN